MKKQLILFATQYEYPRTHFVLQNGSKPQTCPAIGGRCHPLTHLRVKTHGFTWPEMVRKKATKVNLLWL